MILSEEGLVNTVLCPSLVPYYLPCPRGFVTHDRERTEITFPFDKGVLNDMAIEGLFLSSMPTACSIISRAVLICRRSY